MKAKHRHELKTNELADWLGNIPTWAKQNLRTIIYVAVFGVFLAAYSIYYFYTGKIVASRQRIALTKLVTQLPQTKARILQAQSQGSDISYMLIQQIGDNLDTIANNTKQNSIAALAYVKEAETLRSDLHYRLESPTPENIKKQTEKAKKLYQKALAKSAGNNAVAAIAQFGLGLCEEELGNFDKAKQIYQQIADDARFDGTAPAAAAEQRIKTMHDFTEDITFKPAPKPAQTKAEQSRPQPPQPGSADTNTPSFEKSVQAPEQNLPGK